MGAGTELGLEAKGYMDQGELVPDALVLALLEQRLDEAGPDAGFLLDGFPRNVSQAGRSRTWSATAPSTTSCTSSSMTRRS